jgi:hypothetical protein
MLRRIFTILATTLATITSPIGLVNAGTPPVVPCSNPAPSSYLAQNLNFTLTPEVPVAGGTYVIGVAFDLTESVGPVTAGTMGIKVSLSGFPVANEKKDLCGEVACPITTGHHSYEWPGEVPTGVHGVVTIHEDWMTDKGETLLCLEAKYSL